METNLTKTGSAERALTSFTPEQTALIKTSICPGASDDELKLFITVCQQTGLNPFAKQIHGIKRRRKKVVNGRTTDEWEDYLVIQTGIDGYRLVSERTGKYEGQTSPEWCAKDGKWTDVWLEDTSPHAARVGIYRAGFREPIWGVAHWDGYVQMREGKPTGRWKSDPAGMLAKCAEALGHRKAFPQELSGLYSDVEFGAVDSDDGPRVAMPRRKEVAAPPPSAQGTVSPPAASPEPRTTQAAPEGSQDSNDVPATRTCIVNVERAKGNRPDGSEWTRFDLHCQDGEKYSTFDKDDGEFAERFQGSSIEVVLYYSTGQYGRDLKSIQPLEPK